MASSENSILSLLAQLERQKGVLERTFEKNKTIVEQKMKNDCFFRLKSGRVRFEKRLVENKIVKSAALLGTMDDSAEWPLFCELSAFGIQETTSAAVVAEIDCVVSVIPVEIFNDYISQDQHSHALFYENITKRLAALLRGLHTRTLDLSSLNLTKSGDQINHEAVIFSWPASVKGALASDSGQLLLSRNYVAFVKQKDADRKGIVADATETAKTTLELKMLTEVIFQGSKLIIKDHRNGKIQVSLKKHVKADVVQQMINTAKAYAEKGRCLSPSKESKAMRLTQCSHCTQFYCSMCQCLEAKKNPCPKAENHEFQNTRQSSPVPCRRCGNEGTHILLGSDLKMLMNRFKIISYKPGEIVQAVDSRVERIGYVMEGTVGVSVVSKGGQEIKLSDVVAGETIGDIGVFMGTPSSANLAAGSEGCILLEIPRSFLFDESENQFRVRVCFALSQLMWARILKQEDQQVKIWSKKIMSNEESFLGESLLREGTGKKIDERGVQGWY